MKEHKREEWRTCQNCAHKSVCREASDPRLDCDHHIYNADPNRYGDIYELLQPVFEWLRVQYPNDTMMIIDGLASRLLIERKAFFDDSITNFTRGVMNESKSEDRTT